MILVYNFLLKSNPLHSILLEIIEIIRSQTVLADRKSVQVPHPQQNVWTANIIEKEGYSIKLTTSHP